MTDPLEVRTGLGQPSPALLRAGRGWAARRRTSARYFTPTEWFDIAEARDENERNRTR